MVPTAEQTSQAEDKPLVLFLCTRNSARSQMAEAWLRELANERSVAASAGHEPSQIHPFMMSSMHYCPSVVAVPSSTVLLPVASFCS